MSKTFY